MKALGKLVLFAVLTGAVFFLLFFNVRFIALSSFKAGMNTCSPSLQTNDFRLETDYQNLIAGHRVQSK
jgi:hypothetical protein